MAKLLLESIEYAIIYAPEGVMKHTIIMGLREY